MTSQGEKFGSALAKAIKGTAAAMKERKEPPRKPGPSERSC